MAPVNNDPAMTMGVPPPEGPSYGVTLVTDGVPSAATVQRRKPAAKSAGNRGNAGAAEEDRSRPGHPTLRKRC